MERSTGWPDHVERRLAGRGGSGVGTRFLGRHPERMTEPRASVAEERELVARAKRGDVDAFAALYHAHAAHVFGVCIRLGADRERAVELLQDVFVRIWE